ncbi:MAG TPA: metalloregulator ArsR/SmtB family transcription factor [Phycisphaerales bacterium]|nr:metalloregulator ArsR/SmtB family transcription factor [Phycisphaerales bacterium]
MARVQTVSDAFAAIAEPRRRELLNLLAQCDARDLDHPAPNVRTTHDLPFSGPERDVTWLVETLGWPQPQVSKHLGVLRKAGLVSVVRKGRRRMYSLNGDNLRPVYEWVKNYERFWDHQLRRIKDRAERLEREARLKPRPPASDSR